ncbi:ISAs1 family transposase [Nonomuraea fuscirosea]|uniref:ISAs1 family transposase n=1 Tax=Nonomuraea fuscirosea TaxID=1291556 RepID=UPI0034254D2A
MASAPVTARSQRRAGAFSTGRTHRGLDEAGRLRAPRGAHGKRIDLPDLPTLAEVLDAVLDPRSRRGHRYRLGPPLALSMLAVFSGAISLARITRFIAGYDPELRERAGLPRTVRLAASTLGRLLARLDGDAFGTATCNYLAILATETPPASSPPPSRAPLTGLAEDGKTLRGSRTAAGTAVHLLAATRHDPQTVVAQRQIDSKSNEFPAFTPLLSHLDLTRLVITADALHTQADHARHITAASSHYLFIVKDNQCATPASSRSISVDAWITVLIRCVLLEQELPRKPYSPSACGAGGLGRAGGAVRASLCFDHEVSRWSKNRPIWLGVRTSMA